MTRTGLLLVAAAVVVSLLLPPFFTSAQAPGGEFPFCWKFDSPTSGHDIPCPVTPLPTSTPSPVATATVTPEPSPTIEDTRTPVPTAQPTNTPRPTATVTPVPMPGKCWGTVEADVLNVRTVPYGDKLGAVTKGDYLAFNAQWLDANGQWWWRIWFAPDPDNIGVIYGWTASWWITPGDTAVCSELEDLTPAPIYNAALLWHTVPGFNQGNAQVSYGILASKGIDFGVKPYASMDACLDALARGGACIYRHGAPDCPQSIGSADPRQSARDFLQYGQAARQYLAQYPQGYYEPLNECFYGSSQSDSQLSVIYWWGDWLDEYLTRSTALGFTRLVMPTFGPGHGESTIYHVWADVLNRLAAAGGMMGEHAYTPNISGGLCGCDKWLACRHRTNEAYREAEGVHIQVAITEAARGWGNDPVDVADFVCWYEEVRHDSWLHSVALWTAGYHPSWPLANLDNYMVPIAQGVGS